MAKSRRDIRKARDALFDALVVKPGLAEARGRRRKPRENNVVAVEIGTKLKGGVPTGAICLRVVVRRKTKKPPAKPCNRLPGSCQGIPVDVVEAGGPAVALAHCYVNVAKRLVRPPGIIGGVSIGPRGGTRKFGTAGVVAKRPGSPKERFVLTNRHVVLGPLEPPGNQSVIQPGGARQRLRCVGAVVDAFDIRFDGTPSVADAALVKLHACIRAKPREINCLGMIKAVVVKPSDLERLVLRQQVVRQSGASSRATLGTLAGMHSGVRVRYSNGQEAVFDNQIAIRHAQPDPSKPAPFARLGDSGALVLYEGDQGLVAIGLLFAVTKAFAYATPLKPILDKFNIQLP